MNSDTDDGREHNVNANNNTNSCSKDTNISETMKNTAFSGPLHESNIIQDEDEERYNRNTSNDNNKNFTSSLGDSTEQMAEYGNRGQFNLEHGDNTIQPDNNKVSISSDYNIDDSVEIYDNSLNINDCDDMMRLRGTLTNNSGSLVSAIDNTFSQVNPNLIDEDRRSSPTSQSEPRQDFVSSIDRVSDDDIDNNGIDEEDEDINSIIRRILESQHYTTTAATTALQNNLANTTTTYPPPSTRALTMASSATNNSNNFLNSPFLTIPSAADTVNDSNRNNRKSIGYYVRWFGRQLYQFLKFILLCPIIFLVNVILILLLFVYISCLLVAACFCPSCLERILTSEHTYSAKQIQENLIRRECLQITHLRLGNLNDIEQQQQQASAHGDKLGNDTYEIITPNKKLFFSKPLRPKQTKSNRRQSRIRKRKQTTNSIATTVGSENVTNESPSISLPKPNQNTLSNNPPNMSFVSNHSAIEEVKDDAIRHIREPSIGSISDLEKGNHEFARNNIESVQVCKSAANEKETDIGDDASDEGIYDIGEGCDICMGCYKVGDVITWSANPACGHIFHEKCITEWLCGTQHKITCPCCRNDYIYEMDKNKSRRKRRRTRRILLSRPATTAEAPVAMTTASSPASTADAVSDPLTPTTNLHSSESTTNMGTDPSNVQDRATSESLTEVISVTGASQIDSTNISNQVTLSPSEATNMARVSNSASVVTSSSDDDDTYDSLANTNGEEEEVVFARKKSHGSENVEESIAEL